MKSKNQLCAILRKLQELPKESEWVEFKQNYADPDDIGVYISAISNSALICDKSAGYICWGIENETHKAVGTSFVFTKEKVKQNELENYLTIYLSPRVHFLVYEFEYQGLPVVMLEVPAASANPTEFKNVGYVRVGSCKKSIREHPERARTLWAKLCQTDFESASAMRDVDADGVLQFLDYPKYFDLLKITLPDRAAIIEHLSRDGLINAVGHNCYDITNQGAVLFAKSLSSFPSVSRKALRVVHYAGADRAARAQEQMGDRGYAIGFQSAVAFIRSRLPPSEAIGDAFRSDMPIYPPEAIREFLANALIHQDFFEHGTGPMVEIFSDRMEITNPGRPLIDVLRFIDHPPQSRNEKLASFMRRAGICEERGLGVDRALIAVEFYQMPPPEFAVYDSHTRVTLLSPRLVADMDSSERIRACYQHAVLKSFGPKKMTNETLRKRLGIVDENYPFASRIIRDTIDAKLIKPHGDTHGRHAKYVPIWA